MLIKTYVFRSEVTSFDIANIIGYFNKLSFLTIYFWKKLKKHKLQIIDYKMIKLNYHDFVDSRKTKVVAITSVR